MLFDSRLCLPGDSEFGAGPVELSARVSLGYNQQWHRLNFDKLTETFVLDLESPQSALLDFTVL
jgi:hypothetical protein